MSSDLLRRLEKKEESVQDLKNQLAEALEDNEEKEKSINKAQVIIKKLNDECEKCIKDLTSAEQENSVLKAQLKDNDKALTDANLRVNDHSKLLQT